MNKIVVYRDPDFLTLGAVRTAEEAAERASNAASQAADDAAAAVLAAQQAQADASTADGKAQAALDEIAPAQLRKNTFDATRAPLPSDDETQGYAPGSRWLWQGQEWVYSGSEWKSVPDGATVERITGEWLSPTETSYQGVDIASDAVDQPALGGSKVNGFKVRHRFGGAGARGGRHAIYGVAHQTGQTAVDNPDRNYVGVQGHAMTASGDGGTAPTLAAGRGGYFGMSSIVGIESGAQNLLNVTSFEGNTRVKAGATVAYLATVQIVPKDEVQGAVFDTLLALSKGGAAYVGKKTGILFGNMNGGQPVANDGTLIASVGPGTVQHGIDWSSYTFTGDLITAPRVRLSEAILSLQGTNAGIELGSMTVPGVANIDFHTSGVNRDFDARIVASGGVAVEGTAILTYRGGAHVFVGPVRPDSDNSGVLGGASARWGVIYGTDFRPGSGAAKWTSGAGTPEGAVAAPVGSLYTRTDGSAGTTLYVKESGSGSTGWVAK